MPTSASLHAHRAAIARLTRESRSGGDPSRVRAARRDYAAAKLEAVITDTLRNYPPLTDSQREHLRSLLGGAA
jgi:hypothetical protein